MHSFNYESEEYQKIKEQLQSCSSLQDVKNSFPHFESPSGVSKLFYHEGTSNEYQSYSGRGRYDNSVVMGKEFVVKYKPVCILNPMPDGLEEYCMPFEDIGNFRIQPRCDISNEAIKEAQKALDPVREKVYWDYHAENVGLYNGQPAVFDW